MLIFARVMGVAFILFSLFVLMQAFRPVAPRYSGNSAMRTFEEYEAALIEDSQKPFGVKAAIVFFSLGLLSFAGGEMVKRRRAEVLKKCPRCAELVKSDALVCRFCQHDFAAAEKARQAATFAPSEPAQKLCPKCHQSVMKEAVACKHCGHQFVARNIRRA